MQNNYNREETFEVTYAGFFVRLAAFIIDSLIVGIVTLGIKIPVWCVALIFPNAFWNQGILFQLTMVDIFIYLLSVTYFVLFTYCAGATLGKKVMNLQVVNAKGEALTKMQVVYRETVGRYLSMVLCNLGYLMVFVHKEKCSLHDVLADTQVIYGKRIKTDMYGSSGAEQTS